MQKSNLDLLVKCAAKHPSDPLCQLINAAAAKSLKMMHDLGLAEAQVAMAPATLKETLTAAKYVVNEDEENHAAEHGYRTFDNLYRVLVHAPPDPATPDVPGKVVAMGAAGDQPEALLHAMLGYVRERDIAKFGFIVPVEFYGIDPERLNGLKLNDVAIPEATIARLKAHLLGK